MEKYLGSIDKTDNGRIDVTFKETGGKTFLDIRRMYKTKKMDEFMPTKKGIFLPVNKLRAVHRAIGKAIKIAEKAGVLEKE